MQIKEKNNGRYFYFGEIKNNKPNGYGLKILANKKVFEGYFENDMLNGYGIF
jgi:hypothetical protein